MRNVETHFEQVPIEVVRNIVRQVAAPVGMREESPARISELKHLPDAEFLKGRAPEAVSAERDAVKMNPEFPTDLTIEDKVRL
jgi:hypothetical protein